MLRIAFENPLVLPLLAGARIWDSGAQIWDMGAKIWDSGAVALTTESACRGLERFKESLEPVSKPGTTR